MCLVAGFMSAKCKFCNDTGVDEMTDAYRRFIRCDHCDEGIRAEIENRMQIIQQQLAGAMENVNVVTQLQQVLVKK